MLRLPAQLIVWLLLAVSGARSQNISSQPAEGEDPAGQSECIPSRIQSRPGRLDEGSPLVHFLHIPKCGGTSVQKALMLIANNNQLPIFTMSPSPNEKVLYSYNGGGTAWGSTAWGSTAWGSNHDKLSGLLVGHRGYGFSAEVSAQIPPPMTVVVLREPIAFLISLHDYVMNGFPGQDNFTIKKKWWGSETLEETLVRYNSSLAAGLDPNEEMKSLESWFNVASEFLCGYNYCDGLSTAAKLDLAKQHLLQSDCVVTLSRLDDLIPQLRYHLDWIPDSFEWPHLNYAKHEKSVLSEPIRGLLRKWMAPSFELYDLALKIEQRLTKNALECGSRSNTTSTTV